MTKEMEDLIKEALEKERKIIALELMEYGLAMDVIARCTHLQVSEVK